MVGDDGMYLMHRLTDSVDAGPTAFTIRCQQVLRMSPRPVC